MTPLGAMPPSSCPCWAPMYWHGDIDRADTTPLGAMPPAAALVGLPCTATSAPGGSISSVAGIPSTPVLGDMLSLGGLLTPRLTTKIPAAGA